MQQLDSFLLRPMAAEDIEAVVAVERLCHPSPWTAELFRRELENPLARVDLLWCGDRLAGYLCSWNVAGELEIHNVATAPSFRRRGVARTLLRHVLGGDRPKKVQRAFLEVRAGNEGAIALYRSFGFRTLARRERYYADGEDALVMESTAEEDWKS